MIAPPMSSSERILEARSILGWVQARHPVRITAGATFLITAILESAPEHVTLGSLLDAHGIVHGTARFWVGKKMLPPPSAWFFMARGLHAAREIRRRAGEPLLAIAFDLGYADHTAICNLLRRQLGARPRDIRASEGWEPLVTAWWARHAARRLAPPRHTLTRSAA